MRSVLCPPPARTSAHGEDNASDGAFSQTFLLRVLKSGALMSSACTLSMITASLLERSSPWTALNAMASGIGIGGRRPSDRSGPVTAVGGGLLVGGLFLWAGLYQGVLAVCRRRPSLATGAVAALGGFLVDRILLHRTLMPAFRHALGRAGMLAKYTAIALAAARST